MEIVNAPAEPSISAADSQPTLHDLERIIEEGEARRKASYRKTGKALCEIKSRGLFKETHRTWQDYVTKRWGFSRQRAHQLMQAWAEAEMSTALDIAKTEREARRRRQGSQPELRVKRSHCRTVSLRIWKRNSTLSKGKCRGGKSSCHAKTLRVNFSPKRGTRMTNRQKRR
jgi:hypothetical protein